MVPSCFYYNKSSKEWVIRKIRKSPLGFDQTLRDKGEVAYNKLSNVVFMGGVLQ